MEQLSTFSKVGNGSASIYPLIDFYGKICLLIDKSSMYQNAGKMLFSNDAKQWDTIGSLPDSFNGNACVFNGKVYLIGLNSIWASK